jgi:hypothetical protein
MATRYWVGGSGTWDATSTTNWSASSGGASGASAPTAVDDVIFDAASNVGTGAFTVTVSAALCRDFSTGGAGGALDGAMTLAMGTSTLAVSGSWTNPATNFAFSGTGTITFNATTTGKTITTNGISWPSAVVFNGSGGAWTLGGAWTTTSTITVTAGTFSTSATNYSLSATVLSSSNSNTRTISLNASAVTLSLSGTALDFTTATNLTLNAGTSTITCSGTSPTFNGGGQTFYNVTFSSTGTGTASITGVNVFNNLTFATIAATGYRIVSLGANQTVNATLTLNTATVGVRRMQFVSSTLGTARTITAATLAAASDVDFRDITAAGASAPWSGTRFGDALGNTSITFGAGVTKYWNLAAGGSWSSTAWALSSGGAVAATNFPLPQDSVIIENTGLNTGATITIDVNWWIGSLNCSTRTNAFNWSQGNFDPVFYGATITLSSSMTMTTISGSPTFTFAGRGLTQTFTSAGIQLRLSGFTVNNLTGSVVLVGNTLIDLDSSATGTATLTSGTLDLNNNTLTCYTFSSSASTTRTLAFGTGKIVLPGGGATIFTTTTATALTVTGTPLVQCTYSGSVGSRGISMGAAGEANAISVEITGGSDIISLATTSGSYKNVTFSSSFTGSISFANSPNIFGNWDIGGATSFAGIGSLTFAATSGTQTINFNGISFPNNITFGSSATTATTFKLTGTLLASATSTITLGGGALQLNGYNITGGIFSSSASVQRSIAFGSNSITVSGNNTTVWSCATLTNFSYTGIPTTNFTYSGSTGTRTIQHGSTGGTASNAVNMSISAGTDTITLSTTGVVKNLAFSGFTGSSNLPGFIYGDLTLGSGMTITTATSTGPTFAATSGTQTITSNGVTIDRPIYIDASGATISCADALTITQALSITNGTLQLKSGTTSTVGSFVTSGTNQKYLQATTAGSQATISDASGTNTVSYLTIQDSNATGGATWQAYTTSSNINAGNNTGWTFYFNIYDSTISESATATDAVGTNAIFVSSVSETPSITDTVLGRYLWDSIDDSQTANWQNVNNTQTPGWTVINT